MFAGSHAKGPGRVIIWYHVVVRRGDDIPSKLFNRVLIHTSRCPEVSTPGPYTGICVVLQGTQGLNGDTQFVSLRPFVSSDRPFL